MRLVRANSFLKLFRKFIYSSGLDRLRGCRTSLLCQLSLIFRQILVGLICLQLGVSPLWAQGPDQPNSVGQDLGDAESLSTARQGNLANTNESEQAPRRIAATEGNSKAKSTLMDVAVIMAFNRVIQMDSEHTPAEHLDSSDETNSDLTPLERLGSPLIANGRDWERAMMDMVNVEEAFKERNESRPDIAGYRFFPLLGNISLGGFLSHVKSESQKKPYHPYHLGQTKVLSWKGEEFGSSDAALFFRGHLFLSYTLGEKVLAALLDNQEILDSEIFANGESSQDLANIVFSMIVHSRVGSLDSKGRSIHPAGPLHETLEKVGYYDRSGGLEEALNQKYGPSAESAHKGNAYKWMRKSFAQIKEGDWVSLVKSHGRLRGKERDMLHGLLMTLNLAGATWLSFGDGSGTHAPAQARLFSSLLSLSHHFVESLDIGLKSKDNSTTISNMVRRYLPDTLYNKAVRWIDDFRLMTLGKVFYRSLYDYQGGPARDMLGFKALKKKSGTISGDMFAYLNKEGVGFRLNPSYKKRFWNRLGWVFSASLLYLLVVSGPMGSQNNYIYGRYGSDKPGDWYQSMLESMPTTAARAVDKFYLFNRDWGATWSAFQADFRQGGVSQVLEYITHPFVVSWNQFWSDQFFDSPITIAFIFSSILTIAYSYAYRVSSREERFALRATMEDQHQKRPFSRVMRRLVDKTGRRKGKTTLSLCAEALANP